jgi:hypothetical protein
MAAGELPKEDRITVAQAAELLDRAWDHLETQGACDARGGAEYERIIGTLRRIGGDWVGVSGPLPFGGDR